MAEKIKPWKTKNDNDNTMETKEKQAKDEGDRNRHSPDMHAMTQGKDPRKRIYRNALMKEKG